MRVRQCAILAGGLATRLGDLSAASPKPILTCGDRPFLAWLMRELVRYGIEDFVVLGGHLAEVLKPAVRQIALALPKPARVRFSIEPAPLGTAGALKHARGLLEAEFLLCNGDTLFCANLAPLLTEGLPVGGAIGRLLLRRVEDASRFGTAVLRDGRLAAFAERPEPGRPGLINAGLAVFAHALLAHCPPVGSLEREVLPGLAASGALLGEVSEGYFCDIGVPADYRRSQSEVSAALSWPALFTDVQDPAELRTAFGSGRRIYGIADRFAKARLLEAAQLAGCHIDDIRPQLTFAWLRAWDLDPGQCAVLTASPDILNAARDLGIAAFRSAERVEA